MNRVVLAAGFAAAAAALLPGMLPASPDVTAGQEVAARAVRVGTLLPEPVRDVLTLGGRILPAEVVSLHAPASGGRFEAVLVEPGAEVPAGALLARLDATTATQDLAQAEAARAAALARLEAARIRRDLARSDLAVAASEVDRLSTLKARGAVAGTQLGAARVDRDRARDHVTLAQSEVAIATAEHAASAARVALARDALVATEIRSPVAGQVLAVVPRVGQRVAGGAGPLFEIARDGRLVAEMTVLPQDLAGLVPGQPVTIRVAAPARVLPATIGTVPFGQDTGIGPSRLRVALPAATGLRPGLPVTAEVVLGERLALRVPLGALRMTAEGAALLGLRDGRATEIPVTASLDPATGQAEILAGARAGTQVVVRAAALITPGERLRPVMQVER